MQGRDVGPSELLPTLSTAERRHLRDVLSKAEEAQKKEEWRKVHLRKTVVLSPSESALPARGPNCGSTCSACGAGLIRLLRPAYLCGECGLTFCSNCCVPFNQGYTHLCGACVKVIHYRIQSGEWFLSRRRRADRVKKSALEELKEALAQNEQLQRRRREEPWSPLEHNFTFGGSLPSIVIKEDSASDRSSATSLLFRRMGLRDSDCLSIGSGSSMHSLSSDNISPVTSETADDFTEVSEILEMGSPDPSVTKSQHRLPQMPAAKEMSQESITSMYSLLDQNFDLPDHAEHATGDVELSVEFDRRHGFLWVTVRQCKNLLPSTIGKKRTSNPFVKIYLLPDKTRISKRKTTTRKSTINPTFNERFKYQVNHEGIEERSLWITVWHHKVGHNIFLGETIVHIGELDLNDPGPRWYALHEKRCLEVPSPHLIYKGDLTLALVHLPSDDLTVVDNVRVAVKGELQVWIKDAKNLMAVHSNGFSNPFVKVLLLPNRKDKRKTAVIRRTLSPSWNSIMTFESVSASDLAERCVEITVWDHNRVRPNSFLGGLRISLGKGTYEDEPADWMQASGHEVTIWRNVIAKPGIWIEGTLPLRANMD